MEVKKLCWEPVFDWMTSSNKQQTSAFFISALAFRPQIDPASPSLPPPVLPGSRPLVPLHSRVLIKYHPKASS